jgi:hypothetical protein
MKKVAEIHLLPAFKNGNLAEALTPLAHFALETLRIDDSALRAFAREEQVRSHLDRLLRDPSSPVVGSVIAEMSRVGIVVESDEIVSLLRKGTDTPTQPVTPVTRPVPQETITGSAKYVFPAGSEEGLSGLDHLQAWLKAGFWGVRSSTPHRTRLKAGDSSCFYATGVGIVAAAPIVGAADQLVTPTEWPGPGSFHSNVYKVPLGSVRWLEKPIQITPELRQRLDGFAGRDLSRPWAWFIQSTNRLSDHDYALLTDQEPL